MANFSPPHRLYQDTLLELYNGRQHEKEHQLHLQQNNDTASGTSTYAGEGSASGNSGTGLNPHGEVTGNDAFKKNINYSARASHHPQQNGFDDPRIERSGTPNNLNAIGSPNKSADQRIETNSARNNSRNIRSSIEKSSDSLPSKSESNKILSSPDASVSSQTSSLNSLTSPKSRRRKKLGSDYRILPLMSMMRPRQGSSSDSDEEEKKQYNTTPMKSRTHARVNGHSSLGSSGASSLAAKGLTTDPNIPKEIFSQNGLDVSSQSSIVGQKSNVNSNHNASDQELLKEIFESSAAAPKEPINEHSSFGGDTSNKEVHGEWINAPLHLQCSVGNSNSNEKEAHNYQINGNQQDFNKGSETVIKGRPVQRPSGGNVPFTSALGRRIWARYEEQYQQQYDVQDSNDLLISNNKSTVSSMQHHLQQQLKHPPPLNRKMPEESSFFQQGKNHNFSQSSSSIPHSSHHVPQFILSKKYLPSPDFLRLPSTLVQLRSSSSEGSNGNKWADVTELEREVIQCHLDLEASESLGESSLIAQEEDAAFSNFPSPLLTSDCFSCVLDRHPKVGLGMSLREHRGCVYIQALLQLDGTRMEVNTQISEKNGQSDSLVDGMKAVDNDEYSRSDGMLESWSNNRHDQRDETNGGPAFLAGLRPGDRLLGLNGRPFLKGRPAPSDLLGTTYNSNGFDSKRQSPDVAPPEEVLKSIAGAISNATNPLIVHIQRERDTHTLLKMLQRPQSETGRNKGFQQARSSARAATPDRSQSVGGPMKSSPGNFFQSGMKNTPPTKIKRGPVVHPFAKALAERNIIQRGKEEALITKQMRIFTDRTRQWESKLSFRLRASDFSLRPQLDARDVEPTYYASFFDDDGDAPPFFDYKYAKNLRSYSPSTPMIQDWRLSRQDGDFISPVRPINRKLSREAAVLADLYAGLDTDDAEVQDLFVGKSGVTNGDVARRGGGGGLAYPAFPMNAMADPSDIFVPLVGVRKAICVRILNTFLDDKNRRAFTIWCYDVESGNEWYAPVRYFADFKDLRSAISRVDKSIADIPFPSQGWGAFSSLSNEANESTAAIESRRLQLEVFLRRVFAGVYRGRLHPYLAEIAVHLQTFVGCDTAITEGNDASLVLNNQVAINEASYCKRIPELETEPEINARTSLKRSIQRYVYRLFLLPSVEQLVSQFVSAAKKKVTSEAYTGNSSRQKKQFKVDKGIATTDVEKIRDFIDQVQELIMEGCQDDFESISQRRDFIALKNDDDNILRDELFHEAVREQIELEVYVPLRSTISRYLVYAWFNDDVEMKHKIKALANKPQSYFRIQQEHRSPSNWKSVIDILKLGVGLSTLPCVKLRAIVDAAKEITHLDAEERKCLGEESFFNGKVSTKTLGADDFLPIFIYCFVQARLERPSALSALLQTMCDPAKLNGETGYYLASFHAAMTHVHELDLTEAKSDLSIFLDTLP